MGVMYWNQLEYEGIVFKFTTNPPKTTKGMTNNGEAWTAKLGYLQRIPAVMPIKYPQVASNVKMNSLFKTKFTIIKPC